MGKERDPPREKLEHSSDPRAQGVSITKDLSQPSSLENTVSKTVTLFCNKLFPHFLFFEGDDEKTLQ